MLKKQNKIFYKYKENGYKNEDKAIVDRLKNECYEAIKEAKEKHLSVLGAKLADPTTGQKTYLKFLNKFLNKCKVPRIPTLFVLDKFITNCKEKSYFIQHVFCLT